MSAPLRAQGRTSHETLLEAVLHLADVEAAFKDGDADEDDRERAWHRLRVAFNRHREARRTVHD